MLRGLYSAASGMITQQRKHDSVTNNIANMNTPGYKEEISLARSFPEMMISIMRSEDGQGQKKIGRLSMGVMAEENINLFKQGALRETGNASDIALVSNIQVPGLTFNEGGKAITPDGQVVFQPQAFFTIKDAEGQIKYTRNGKFTVNAQNELVTAEGSHILGIDQQPLQINIPISDVKINPSGELINGVTGQRLLNSTGAPMAMLISKIDNPNMLIKEGDGNYRLADGATAAFVQPGEQVELRQGFIEGSNVDPAQSTVDLMTAARAYEANQKVIQFYDKSLEKAVNEVGRI